MEDSVMAEPYRDALDALRRPLEFVARDGFKNLDVVRDLGASLETAAARLVGHLPERRQPVPVGALEPGRPQLTRARVVRARVIPAYRRRILAVELEGDDGKPLGARWFHFRGRMLERFPVGARFLLLGTPRPWKGALEM